jgi:hypothetical protein
LALALITLLPAPRPARAADNDLAATVKSAYIYNFIQFIDWPEPKGGPPEFIKICMVGYQSGTGLTALSSRQGKGLPIIVEQHTPDPDSLTSCQIVVINRSMEAQLPQILARLAGTPVLTVSDIPQFAERGGGIGFVIKEGKVRIEINSRTTQQAGLKVSAKLLEVARIVQ